MANTVINTPELLNLDSTTGATVLAKGTVNERPPTPGISVDYLVVAGGGGGGGGVTSESPGAGGAGAVIYQAAGLNVIPSSEYTLYIADGGAGGGNNTQGTNGQDSYISFGGSNVVLAKGGGGGGSNAGPGKDGGSGGGGTRDGDANSSQVGGSAVATNIAPAGASIYGNNGATGTGSTGCSGGGGGAGGAGTVPAGGDGIQINIDGNNYYWGGGGGACGSAGTGGQGGGGGGPRGGQGGTGGINPGASTGSSADGGGNGGANTGGGGGGATNPTSYPGGNGGSGIIILRYPNTFTLTLASGSLTTGQLNTAVGTDEKYTSFTGGTGTISFSGTVVGGDSDATDGTLRFNTDTNKTEYFDGTNWYEIVDEYASGFIGPATNYFATKLYTGNNATQSIGGYINGSASFNGSSSAIVLPNNILSSDFSISAWFYLNNTSGNQYLFEFDYENRVLFRVSSTDNNWAYIGNSGYFNPGITYNAGQWYNVVITFSNGNPFKIYVNGLLSYTSGNTSVSAFSNDNILGAANSSGSGAVNGLIDQVRIYNTELSSGDVAALNLETATTASTAAFPSGQTAIATYTMDTSANGLLTTTDLSTVDYPSGAGCYVLYEMNGNSNDTNNTYNGTPTNITYQGGAFDQAAVFNGSNSKIDTGISSISSPFSVSMWINEDSLASGQFFSNWNSTSADMYWETTSDGRLRISIDGYSQQFFGTAGDVTAKTWHHIAVALGSGSYEVFLDGTSLGTSTTSVTTFSSGQNFMIGNSAKPSSPYPFDGLIDQVRIFNTKLTQAQVTTLARGIATSYSGAATNVNFNGHLDFAPDLVWVKSTDSSSYDHNLYDSVRGVLKRIKSNTNSLEDSNGKLSSFDANGFSLIAGGDANASGQYMVSWNWKAGGAAVANNDGTIPSQVSVNKDSGFSIVKYTGNATAGATVGHGLGTKPQFILFKNLDANVNWIAYDTINNVIGYLDLTDSLTDGRRAWAVNNTDPTSTLVTLGNNQATNYSQNYIMYCWHSVDNFSKIGSYTGNGNVSGPTITTNFEPSWVMVKRIDSTSAWNIQDNKRNPTNPRNTILQADDAAGDITNTAYNINFDSTSFQIVNTGSNWNTLNGTYLYMAIA